MVCSCLFSILFFCVFDFVCARYSAYVIWNSMNVV